MTYVNCNNYNYTINIYTMTYTFIYKIGGLHLNVRYMVMI